MYYYTISNDTITLIRFPALERRKPLIFGLVALTTFLTDLVLYGLEWAI